MNVLVVWKESVYEGGARELKDVLFKGLADYGCNIKVVEDGSVLLSWIKTQKSLKWADVVVCGEFPSIVTTWPFCRKPVLWVTEGVPELFYSLREAPLMSLHRHIIKNSNHKYITYPNKYLEMELNRFYGKADYFLPFGVDWNFFSEGIRVKDDAFTMVQVGYIGRLKNQLATLGIFNVLLSKIPQAKLVFIGPKLPIGSGSSYWDKVTNIIRAKGWEDKVTITGQIPKEEVREYFYRSSLLIHPVGPYGGQLTPFEALSTGLPVITSPIFLNKELIEPFGLVTDNYSEAVWKVYEAWDRYHSMALAGGEWVKYNLTWAHYLRGFMGILEEIVR